MLDENMMLAWRDRASRALAIAQASETAPAFFKPSYLHDTLREEYLHAWNQVSLWSQ